MRKIFLLYLVLLLSPLMISCDQKKSALVQGYIEGRFTYVASSVSGHLLQRFVNRGAEVKRGQVLFTLDPYPQSAQLLQANENMEAEQEKLLDLEKGSRKTILQSLTALLHQAQSDLDLAKITVQRREKLLKTGAVSQEEYDAAYADYARKYKAVVKLHADLDEAKQGARENAIREERNRVSATQAEVKRLTWELAQKTARAPVDGVVFDTFFRIGEFVQAGQPVLSMLAPQNIYVVFFAPESILGALQVGQQINFQCDGCKKEAATIYFISPNSEYTPPVLFTKESREKLVYRVEARIPISRAANFHPGQPVDIYLGMTKNVKQ